MFVDLDRMPPVSEPKVFRLRLLCVMLDIEGGGNDVVLFLTPEADGWISVREPSGAKRAVYVPADRIELNDGLGVLLQDGAIIDKPFDTRPLFGTYTLRIDPESYELIKGRRDFKATLHFMAIGMND
jgi:hypothetical protein